MSNYLLKHLRIDFLQAAIDVIDEAGAAQRLQPPGKRKKKKIGQSDIEKIIAKIAQIPPKSVTPDDRSALATWSAS